VSSFTLTIRRAAGSPDASFGLGGVAATEPFELLYGLMSGTDWAGRRNIDAGEDGTDTKRKKVISPTSVTAAAAMVAILPRMALDTGRSD
jgi:hypothetical protein